MTKKDYKVRLAIIQEIRKYLSNYTFLEVETPILSSYAIPESTITLFKIQKTGLQLLPSPEYYMKQLLASGWGNIFQFSRSFREGDCGPLHGIEFSMLEYYWVEHDYMQNMQFTEKMIKELAEKFMGICPSFHRMSMAEAFSQYGNISLEELCGEGTIPHENDCIRLKETCQRFTISYREDDSWEVLFHRLFLNLIEPILLLSQHSDILFLYDYPAKLQTLSKNKVGTPWTERWELYWYGIEIANCFTEETDELEIKKFFDHEIQMDNKNSTIPDMHYAKKIASMPLCSGTALGLDRLVMILMKKKTIHEIIPYSLI